MDDNFRTNIKNVMKIRNITVKELSEKTNISLNTLNSYLKTDGPVPNVINGFKIAKALGTTVEYLITGIEEENGISSNKDSVYLENIDFIADMRKIPSELQASIKKMIADFAEKH